MNEPVSNDDFGFLTFFSILWSLAVMGYIGCITFLTIPEKNQRYADTILGFLLGSVVSVVLKYWFDTSRASAKKDAVIAASLPPGGQTPDGAGTSLPPGKPPSPLVGPGDNTATTASSNQGAQQSASSSGIG